MDCTSRHANDGKACIPRLMEEHVPFGEAHWTPQLRSNATHVYPLPHSNIWSPAFAAIGEGMRMRRRLAEWCSLAMLYASQRTTDIA
jgi:hypothetical protein